MLPYVEKLKAANLDLNYSSYINIIDDHLKEILSPFLGKLTSKHSNFTPREIQVDTLIKDGVTTKEIANFLNISTNSIDVYRQNTRRSWIYPYRNLSFPHPGMRKPPATRRLS